MKLKDMTTVQDGGGLKGTSKLWRLSILIMFIGLVIYVIGYSTDEWCGLENESFDSLPGAVVDCHFGLWRKCMVVTVVNTSLVVSAECEDMDNDDDFKPAAKSLCSIGLIFITFGLIVAFVGGCQQSTKFMSAGGALVIFGAVVSAIGAAVFIGKAKDKEDRLEPYYSSFFALIGPAILILGGGLELLSIKSGYDTIA